MNASQDAESMSSLSSLVYAALFPSGIEDVVRAALSRLAIHYQLQLETCTYDDAAVVRATNTPTCFTSTAAEQRSSLTPRGLLLFRVRQQNQDPCSCSAALQDFGVEGSRMCEFLAAACTLRVIERLSLHQWSIPIFGRSNEDIMAAMHGVITAEAERTRYDVVRVLSAVRSAWGTLRDANEAVLPRAALLWGPQFFHSLTDADVAFRVNCERRVMEDRLGSLKSVDLAAAAGDTLWELHNRHQWEVSMLYNNVEFFLLQDNDHWLTSTLTLSPPAPPRCGYDIDATFQYAAELLRQHICVALRREEISLSQVKGLVPRVSADRQEIRWSKGACAMRSSLANALCTYAGVEEVAGISACPILMLDPFCGCGTTLLEGWVHLLDRTSCAAEGAGGALMGSELEAADVRRTLRNTRAEYLAWMAALYGYGTLRRQASALPWRHVEEKVEEKVEKWRRAVEDRVTAVVRDGSYLTCGADGLRKLLCGSIDDPFDQHSGACAGMGRNPLPNVGCSFSVLRCDATRVPVCDGAVECIVSDMPFGRRCGSHKVNVRLYPRFLRECHRVLRSSSSKAQACEEVRENDTCPSVSSWWLRQLGRDGRESLGHFGGRAVLLTVEYRLMMDTLEALREECPLNLVTPPFQVDMNGLFPFVFVLDKMQ